MQWYSIKKYIPPIGIPLFIRFVVNGEPGGDTFYDIGEYKGEYHWESAFIDDHCIVTHFIVPDAVQKDD